MQLTASQTPPVKKPGAHRVFCFPHFFLEISPNLY